MQAFMMWVNVAFASGCLFVLGVVFFDGAVSFVQAFEIVDYESARDFVFLIFLVAHSLLISALVSFMADCYIKARTSS